MLFYLEVQRGCDRFECPTPCNELGSPKVQIDPVLVNEIIRSIKLPNLDIHLYGFGEVGGYPYHKVDVDGCSVALTNKSYYLADSIMNKGANVFSRVDSINDCMNLPNSTGYFSIAHSKLQIGLIKKYIGHRPYAVKSFDNHTSSQICGLDLDAVVSIIGTPSHVIKYSVPSTHCKIPIIRYEDNELILYPCVSDMHAKGIPFDSGIDILNIKCRACYRYPKEKFIAYYEP